MSFIYDGDQMIATQTEKPIGGFLEVNLETLILLKFPSISCTPTRHA